MVKTIIESKKYPRDLFDSLGGKDEELEPFFIGGHKVLRIGKEVVMPDIAEGSLGYLVYKHSADGSYRVEGVELYDNKEIAITSCEGGPNPEAVAICYYHPTHPYYGDPRHDTEIFTHTVEGGGTPFLLLARFQDCPGFSL